MAEPVFPSIRIRSTLSALGLVFLAVLVAACGSASTSTTGEVVQSKAQQAEAAPTATAEEPAPPTATAVPEPDPTSMPAPTPPPSATPSATPEPTATAEPTPVPVVFNNDFGTSVQPIFEANCAACHVAGTAGATHWQLGTAQDLADTHLWIASVIASDYMPPWPASDLSVPFAEDFSLRDDQLQAIADWSAAGAPLDVDPSTPIAPANGINRLTDPDMVITPPEPYLSDPSKVDDYRCLIYDPELPEGGWVTGWEFLPDSHHTVHHAVGYLVPGSKMELARERDGADGRPGWECFGTSGLGQDALVVGWAPGQSALQMPEDSGLWLDPDTFFVIQIHYHSKGNAPADSSSFALTLASEADLEATDGWIQQAFVATVLGPAEIPCGPGEVGPLCDRAAARANAIERFGGEGVWADRINTVCRVTPEDFADMTEGVASSSCDLPARAVSPPGDLFSVFGHMHELGDWFRLTLNPDTPEETVLLDIPDWDFDWQLNYQLEESVTIDDNDTIRIECGWDRARRDPALEPSYVLWADGTNDEMCFATFFVLRSD